jgi:anti-anti-sigma factor
MKTRGTVKETKSMTAVVAQRMKGYCLVSARGHLDAAGMGTLEQVVRITGLSRDRNVWVDCGAVTSISTEALRAVLALSGRAEKEGIALVFYQLSPALGSALQEAGLESVLRIVPGIADAYRYCRQNNSQ